MKAPMPEMKVFWNEKCPGAIVEYFGERNVLTGINDLSEENYLELNRCSAILILCELKEKKVSGSLQEMYGVEIAKKLRREGVNVPIIFTSFLSRKQLCYEKPERGIVNAIGHHFFQLPFGMGEISDVVANAPPLNDLEMYDVVSNFCDLPGIVRMLIHSLSQGVPMDSDEEGANAMEKFKNAIIQVHQLFASDPRPDLDKFDDKFARISKNNFSAAYQFVETVGGELLGKYAPSENADQTLKAEGNWKLLLLDDVISADHPFVKRLEDRALEVICVRTAAEAHSAIAREALIALVVSDYRLEDEEGDIKIQQPVQGYQFLKKLSDDRPGYLRLAALSSLPRKFLMHSFKHYGIRVEIFSKKDYLENEANIEVLCDELVELGNENMEAITRLPSISSDTWHLFEPFYKYHRNSVSYVANEEYISDKAKQYCDGVLQKQYPFDLDGYTSMNLGAERAKPEDKKSFNHYINKCICRRVALWYTQNNKSWQLNDIHKVIKGKNYTGNETAIAARNQINVNLALSLTEYPWNMTIEERNWLLFQMGLNNIEEVERKELFILRQAEKDIKQWLYDNKLEDNIKADKKFEIFFVNGEDCYGRSFRLFKSFLYELSTYVVGRDFLVRSLQSQIIRWEEAFIEKAFSSNIRRFFDYLKLLRKRLQNSSKLILNPNVPIGTGEELYQQIVKDALPKIATHEHADFQTNAVLFYNDKIGTEKFATKKAWVTALLEFHAEEMKALNSVGIGFDEVKAFRRQRGGSDDYSQ